MKEYQINQQQGKAIAEMTRTLKRNGWITSGPTQEQNMDPSDIDKNHKIRFYSNGEGTHVLIPDDVEDLLPEDAEVSSLITDILDARGHSTNMDTAEQFLNVMKEAHINNRDISLSLEEAIRSGELLRGYRCMSILAARETK